jgi:hypothetical protein
MRMVESSVPPMPPTYRVNLRARGYILEPGGKVLRISSNTGGTTVSTWISVSFTTLMNAVGSRQKSS